ncbi:MAG: hypothetical protein LBJ25_05935 [Candidatus Margulisbacteria bacterium]|nr:hypothetical protein [Candidatus Margulisiibacteriota bacterium]
MANAGNYTDATDTDFKAESYNIDEGKKLSAEGMRAALHTRENVANKQVASTDDTADTLTANSSDSYYPSAKLAGKNLDALRTTKEDKSNKATAINAENLNDPAKYPTIGAVTAWATATLMDIFLPIGTIIAMHNKTYYNTANAAFKAKWKICDGNNGTPNLTNLFLRGMPDGGTVAVGSDSTTLTTSNLPDHTHTFTGNNVTGGFGWIGSDGNNSNSYLFTAAYGCFSGESQANPNNTYTPDHDGWGARGYRGVGFSMTPSGSVTGGGGSPQTAVPIVPKYYAVIYVMKVA